MVQYLWLAPLGVLIGAFGTLIGAGGGFLLAPLLLLAYPPKAPKLLPVSPWRWYSLMPALAPWPMPGCGRLTIAPGCSLPSQQFPGL